MDLSNKFSFSYQKIELESTASVFYGALKVGILSFQETDASLCHNTQVKYD